MSAKTGRTSETLNVIYVVDDRGKLIDYLRIREFLLKPLTSKGGRDRDQDLRGPRGQRFSGRGVERLPQIRSERIAGNRFPRRARRNGHGR